jgi:hypothetical protein
MLSEKVRPCPVADTGMAEPIRETNSGGEELRSKSNSRRGESMLARAPTMPELYRFPGHDERRCRLVSLSASLTLQIR